MFSERTLDSLFPAPRMRGPHSALRGSLRWKDVSLLGTQVETQSNWFSGGVTKRICNGNLTSFCFDPWMDGVPLKIWSQRTLPREVIANLAKIWDSWAMTSYCLSLATPTR
ncbi:hypothetical protein L195_g022808 [Trifolium pratense]|uniref:Cysteine-rich receptor-like protein kinase n=1 Tax=Trifolium pratense TaxID=57577 RepID=A0A2K3N933_TRIPR|nr:hypothetical protein L195_g022808 [Trifolium pratense]